MNIINLSLALSLIVALLAVTSNAVDTDSSNSIKTKPWPKLFDFNLFARIYHRVYAGPLETLKRKAIFMANSLKVFLHNILWTRGQSRHYLKIGPYTDYAEEEIHELYYHEDEDIKSDEHPKTVGINEENLKSVLSQVVESHVPGSDVIAEALKDRVNLDNGKTRNKRSTDNTKRKRSKKHEQAHKRSRRIPNEISKENIAYSEPKPSDSNSENENINSDHDDRMPLTPVDIDILANNNSTGELATNQLVDQFLSQINKSSGDADDDDDDDRFYDAEDDDEFVDASDEDADDRLYHDWRTSNCLTVPKSQRRCGSCWAFATTGILEYEYCRQKGRLVSFSEQYYVDCSLKFKPEKYQILGCKGGVSTHVLYLVNHFGVEMSRIYPYIGQNGQCPYEYNFREKKGRMRPQIEQMKHEKWNEPYVLSRLDEYISEGPVMSAIYVPKDFSLYGGGVHTGETCDKSEGHAMIAIGDGIEDGVEYWLFRNSYSSLWGEDGHFKLAKSAPKECHNSVIYWRVKFPEHHELIVSPSKRKSV